MLVINFVKLFLFISIEYGASYVDDAAEKQGSTGERSQGQAHDAINAPAADDIMAAVVAESHAIHQLRQTALKVHEKRLDTVLSFNGLERVNVTADGNCFFHAAALHMLVPDHQSLR